jgi:CBS domain-containing protein
LGAELEAESTDGIFHRKRVQDVLTHRLALGRPETSARELAKLMRDRGIGSVVVVDEDTRPLGIVTESDLVHKVIADDAADVVAREIMSSPPVTVTPQEKLSEALYLMLKHRCRRLVVTDDERVTGVLNMGDLLRLGGHESRALSARIERAAGLDELRARRREIEEFTRRLYLSEVDAPRLAEIVTDLNDDLVRRLIQLNLERLGRESGPPPRAFAWVSFGSDGRREQVLRGDQDNGLVIAGDATDGSIRQYFDTLACRVNEELAELGFSSCKGGVMACEEKYSGFVRDWQERIFVMVHGSDEGEALRDLSIVTDLRLVDGEAGLVDQLWSSLLAEIDRHPPVLRALAQDAAEKPSGLNRLGRLHYEKTGDGTRGVNLKRYGLLPLTAGVKALALEQGIAASTTRDRLRGLEESGRVDRHKTASLFMAHQLFLKLKLHGSIQQIFHGRGSPYFFDPEEWTEWDREQLKEAFRAVGQLRDMLRTRFLLSWR